MSGETSHDEAQLRVLLSVTQKIEKGAVEEAWKELCECPDLETAVLPFPAPVLDGVTIIPLVYTAIKASTSIHALPEAVEVLILEFSFLKKIIFFFFIFHFPPFNPLKSLTSPSPFYSRTHWLGL